MKRRDLIQHLESNGCEFLREGKKHSVYVNRRPRKHQLYQGIEKSMNS